MGDILHGTVKWFAKEKGYGVLKAYKDNETTGDIFVHGSKISQSKEDECEGHRHLNRGDAVEFWIQYNGRKDRHEAQDVNRIPRKQLKSKNQLETKRKQENKEWLRRMEEEDKARKEQDKKSQDAWDKKTEELVSQMRYKKHIEFSESEKRYSVCELIYGDFIPILIYKSGYYLICDLCGKKEHIGTYKPAVIKKKVVETPIFWGFSSYNATVHCLTDGEREVEVDIHNLERQFGRCVHEFAKF